MNTPTPTYLSHSHGIVLIVVMMLCKILCHGRAEIGVYHLTGESVAPFIPGGNMRPLS